MKYDLIEIFNDLIKRSESIVLRSLNYGETSKIVQLYTMDSGHVTVMAKGARKPGSKFGSCLEPTSIIDSIYYFKSERNIQTLSDASHLNRLTNLAKDLDKYGAAIMMVELLSKLEITTIHRKGVFQMVSLLLDALNSTDAVPSVLWNCLRLRLLGLLGFEPSFEKEDVAGVGEEGGELNLTNGSIAAQSSTRSGDMILHGSRLGLRTFAILSRSDMSHILGLETSKEVMDEVSGLVSAYSSYHLPHIPISKAWKVLEELKG